MTDALKKASAPKEVLITRDELPLYCPRDKEKTWALHPRVFLDIEDAPDHRVICPYCGTRYVLQAPK
ncbi:MAG: zinc-finger domain-containing protein [Thiotrichales bacterium]